MEIADGNFQPTVLSNDAICQGKRSGVLFYCAAFQKGFDLPLLIAELPEDFRGVFAKHGTAAKFRKSHLLTTQAATHQHG